MSVKTQSQADLILAEKLVSEVEQLKNPEISNIYGGLCHNFPVLVRTCGLCQALAFSTEKASGEGPRARAHKQLLCHVARVLNASGDDPLDRVRSGDVAQYIRDTRRLLSAWIYFKRFAVSILKVKPGEGEKEGS